MKAVWKGVTLAESDDTVVVEGNHYFPSGAIKRDLFRPSETHTTCPWKGIASYYDVVVDGQINKDAAWYYPHPEGRGEERCGPRRLLEGREGLGVRRSGQRLASR